MIRKYEVLSELLEEIVWGGHIETYRIYEVVEAESHAQAKWKAWKKDRNSFTGNVRDMPKFSVKLFRGSENETFQNS